jgi:peptidoglycan/LPS O-acetylase OafA/YrhL
MRVFYLKGLNGLRAIAALAVLTSHILQAGDGHGLDLAGFGVTLFFALSGFLITVLLLKEQQQSNTIKVGKFYVRRVLRIWPLYFGYMALVLFVHANVFFKPYNLQQVLFYVFFVPNIPFIIGGAIDMLYHYWSLGVEEQFYLFWPLVTKKFINRFVPFCLGFILLLLAIKVFISLVYGGYSVPYSFAYMLRFDCMAIGALGAYLYHNRVSYLAVLKHPVIQVLAWGVLVLVLFNQFHVFSIIDHELVALVTVVLIINQIDNPNTMINLEYPVFDYLGKLSFGIYVFHPLLIALLISLFKSYAVPMQGGSYITFVLLVVVATLLTAHLSYHYFESRFLLLKQKFAVVKSANSAQLL